jgi:hypothetical protein
MASSTRPTAEKSLSVLATLVGPAPVLTLHRVSILTTSVDIGANASAEEAEEGAEDTENQVLDIVHSFRLNETGFDKKSYLSHLKGYMKAVKAKLTEQGKSAEEITAFEKGAQSFAKKVVANFKDYEFLIGEGMDPDAM